MTTNGQNLLFAYGALLCPSYLGGLVPEARFVCTGHAEGWQLEFHGPATLIGKEDATVFGALYELSDSDLRRLDRATDEDHRRERVTVDTERAESVIAYAYVATDELAEHLPGAAPSTRYLEALESGYRAHNAPVAAWDALRAAHDRAVR